MQKKFFPIVAALLVISGVVVWTVNKSSEKAKVGSEVQQEEGLPIAEAPDDGVLMETVQKTEVPLFVRDPSLVDGHAIIGEIAGKTWINVNIPVSEGGPEDRPYRVTLRGGNCGNLTDVRYTLNTLLRGSSETFLPMHIGQFRTVLPLSIVVQLPAPSPTIVACGEITSVL